MTAGTVVIVTGAAGAMGSEVALQLARAGLRVACADLKDPAGTADLIVGAGLAGFAAVLDITARSSWNSLTEATLDSYGRIDALVNMAATITDGPDSVFTVDSAEWHRVLGVNVVGPALGMNAVAPVMRGHGAGRIVNVASVVGLRGSPGRAAYSASKGGLIALTRQAAVDLAGFGITVNCIAPGIMEKSMLGREAAPERRRELLRRTPVNRPVPAADVACAVEYFLAPGASTVTGQVLAVDGGWGASLSSGR
jgi:NAD(P)-dependent dehydrogenase (short-subunit alcohol dehydrogenase family)